MHVKEVGRNNNTKRITNTLINLHREGGNNSVKNKAKTKNKNTKGVEINTKKQHHQQHYSVFSFNIKKNRKKYCHIHDIHDIHKKHTLIKHKNTRIYTINWLCVRNKVEIVWKTSKTKSLAVGKENRRCEVEIFDIKKNPRH